MSGYFADGTRFNTAAGAPDHNQMSMDQSLEPQPRRLLARPQHHHTLAQRPQQAPQPSSSLTLSASAPRRTSRLLAGVETLVRKLSRQRLHSAETPPDTNPTPAEPIAPRHPSPSITQPPTISPQISPPQEQVLAPQPEILRAGCNLQNRAQPAPKLQDFHHQNHGVNLQADANTTGPAVTLLPGPILQSDLEPDCDSMDILYHHRPPPQLISDCVPISIEAAGEKIEVDENYANGCKDFEDEAALIEKFRARRRAGVARRQVDGVPLRSVDSASLQYRLSSEAALRCQNLVLSKPRMRKRKKTSHRRDSMAPSETATLDSNGSSLAMSTMSTSSGPSAYRPHADIRV